MPVLDTSGARLHFHLDGQADPQAPLMILLHPVGLVGSWWRPYGRHYGDGWRVAAVDLPGHGRSSALAEGARIADLADGIACLIDHLGGNAHVVGASLGGMVAQELALRHAERVSSLVLMSTVATLSDEVRLAMQARGTLALAAGMDAAAAETAQRWAPAGVESDAFRARCHAQVLRCDVHSWAAAWQAISRIDTWPRLVQLSCPTLVLVGECDTSTSPAHAQALARHVADGRFVQIPGAGHMAAFSRAASCMSAMNRFYAHVAASLT